MTRRLALAWSAGCCLGVAVGALLGSAVRVAADFRRLRRAEPGPGAPQTPSGHSETTAALNAALEAAERSPFPTQRALLDDPAEREAFLAVIHGDEGPCPQYSPGGGLPCSVRGVHTAHIFLGSSGPDRKDDADERIE